MRGDAPAARRGYARHPVVATPSPSRDARFSFVTMTSSDPREPGAPVYDAGSTGAAVPVDKTHTLHNDVLSREKDRFGGFKFGSAFFGWLTAMGTAVLLTALATAIGLAVGAGSGATTDEVADAVADDAGTAGVIGAIVLGLILLISYFAGGYVAGRMARFSGVKQGLAVWIWAVVIAIVVAIVTAIAGSQWEMVGSLQGIPAIPVDAESATLTGILTAIGSAIIALIGALLGGAAGMRYHRKVDRVGLGRQES